MVKPGADNYSDHRFVYIDAAGNFYNGATWVAWADGSAASFMQTATRQGTTSNYEGTPPVGAEEFQLWVWTGTLATSYPVYDGDVDDEEIDAQSGAAYPQTRELGFYWKVNNVLTDVSAGPTIQAWRIDTNAEVVAAGTAMTRDAAGAYHYDIAETGLGLRYTVSFEYPVGVPHTRTYHSYATATEQAEETLTFADALHQDAIDGIKRASGDQGSFEKMSVEERIAADRYARSQSSAGVGFGGLRFVKLIPPGAD